jgi:alpha-glucosidase
VNEVAAQSPVPADTSEWWRGAAIYQIYPRSFADSNGDGIGDLPGIAARLEYVASLGVDAIWISPFYTSPMRDFGYDVADYCDVDPIFGTLADFDALVARAHRLGLKVIVDQVYAHSSDQHPWFVESRQTRGNPKSDWYVWADAKADGSPPSNWQSVFGGPAWTWDARRSQYYMHNFLKEQPQLNLHNPDVQEALLAVARFWLDRGVDGFRIDALNFAMHDPELRDNPPAPATNAKRTRPFDFQLKQRNQSHPDIVRFIERIRALTDEYASEIRGILTMAEVGGDNSDAEMKEYTEGDRRLNSAYGFDFLYAPELTGPLVCRTVAQWPAEPGIGWPSWAFENHDAPRAVSRWCKHGDVEAFLPLKLTLMVALRGNIILFQGEELGLEQDEIPFELLQDPEAIANWPLTLSRDGVRTPLPWQADLPHGGFTQGAPWLPLSERNRARAIDVQESDPRSPLQLTRDLLALRKQELALRIGTAECRTDGSLLELHRRHESESVRCLFNLGERSIALDQPVEGLVLHAVNGATPSNLPPLAGILVKSC